MFESYHDKWMKSWGGGQNRKSINLGGHGPLAPLVLPPMLKLYPPSKKLQQLVYNIDHCCYYCYCCYCCCYCYCCYYCYCYCCCYYCYYCCYYCYYYVPTADKEVLWHLCEHDVFPNFFCYLDKHCPYCHNSIIYASVGWASIQLFMVHSRSVNIPSCCFTKDLDRK